MTARLPAIRNGTKGRESIPFFRAVIAFVALPTIAKQTNGKTEIIRVTKPVLKGEQLSADNTETVEVGSYNLPPNIAHSLGTKGRESIPFFRPAAREIQAARPEAMSRTASIREGP